MKNVIKQISSLISNRNSAPAVKCNYSNNYYGDQVCRKAGTGEQSSN